MTGAGAAVSSFWPVLTGGGLILLILLVGLLVFLSLRQARQIGELALRQAQLGAKAPSDAFTETQNKQLEESLRQARERASRADRANQAKSAFLTMMSHELRTPLSAIIGFAEMIEQQALGPIGIGRYSDYATDIRQSGQHLLGIINDILDLSKVESGRESLQEEDIAPAMLFDGVRILVEGRATEAGVTLSFEHSEDLPAIRADQRRLTQILVNLLSNAVKFTPQGGRVCLKSWATEGSGIVFQAIDNGVGIARENIPLALSVFGQVDNDSQHQGTGLGLPLAKALAELHGGTLDLQSELGEGTTVTLRLPAYRIVAEPAAEEAPLQQAAG